MRSLTMSYDLNTLDDLTAALLHRARRATVVRPQEDVMADDPTDNTSAVKTIVAGLVDAYPRMDVAKGTVSMYVRALADLPAQALMRAANAWVMESRFFPTVAELRARVIEERVDLPDAIEAWHLIERAIASGSLSELPDEVRRALKAVGGSWAYKTTTRPELMRRDFTSAYELLRANAIRHENLTSAGIPTAARLQLTEGSDDVR